MEEKVLTKQEKKALKKEKRQAEQAAAAAKEMKSKLFTWGVALFSFSWIFLFNCFCWRKRWSKLLSTKLNGVI